MNRERHVPAPPPATPSTPGAPAPAASRRNLAEVAAVFLKMGVTAFGGPAAHVALMEAEFVQRRRWLSREEFLDLLGATNLIPGPNSTEMAIHLGLRRAGWLGWLVAGICFILPAALIVTALAAVYVRFGRLPQAEGVLYGMKPVILAVVLQALGRLGRTAVKTRSLAVTGAAACALNAAGVNELVVIFGTGLCLLIARRFTLPSSGAQTFCLTPLLGMGSASALAAATIAKLPFSLAALFGFFVKVGSVLFGTGYVLLAFLRADLVERWGWLTEGQLLDAIAVGQVTPGPLFTTATFIGYLLGGGAGAFVATAGIFLPAFLFVAVSGPVIPRLRASPLAASFLDGVNVASLAVMAVVSWHLASAAVVDLPTLGIGLAAGLLLLRFGSASLWLLIGGAIMGLALHIKY